MKTIIVACRTLQAEIELAQKNTGTSYSVEYIESGLHERPKKLSAIVQELLDTLDADRVLLCLGQCGNAMIGIKAGAFEMILPKVDDCLSLLLGSTRDKSRISYTDKAFFLTKGWLLGESTIMSQFAKSVEKYGEETALTIMEMMYEHYETLGLIDTGTGPMDELYEQTEDISRLLDLARKTYPGTVSYIEELLTGPWPKDRFIIKKPYEEIVTEDYEGML
ncbi:MAG: DUF1638 domain-containing protein [Firmicutes bacterium]|nr:DUF1638 domain-containing protein [Bacillota bacterium]